VFAAPWEARAFAIVVQLHRASCYSWQEWVSCLSGEIAKTAAAGDEGRPYYEHWLAACERLLRDKGLVDAQALVAKMADIEQRIAGNDDHHDHQHGHDHGHGNRGN
jgi:nitrile hydratase accessory protein